MSKNKSVDILVADHFAAQGCIFSMEGLEYSKVVFQEGSDTFTEDAFNNLVTTMQAQYSAQQYQYARKYPSIGDQLDALWKGGSDAEAMKAQVQAVKDAHPKGE